jgi:hypothetical protein
MLFEKQYNLIGGQYVTAHPDSNMSLNSLYPYYNGYDLIAIKPNGILVYKRRNFVVRLFRYVKFIIKGKRYA